MIDLPPTRSVTTLILTALVIWAVMAYLVMPLWWERFVRKHPELDGVPGITQTSSGIPGDPVNVALVGSEQQVRAIFAAAKWSPADPLSLESDARIAADAVLDRSYSDAPVSNLYLFGRKEDLAFEQASGGSPRERHHVRFWKAPLAHSSAAPLWVGSASFDRSVGLSHTTGQITHHIAPDVDAERDHVIESLRATGQLAEVVPVADFHTVREGRNGGGDPWKTDGTLLLGVIAPPALGP
jgi:hypothetical protein